METAPKLPTDYEVEVEELLNGLEGSIGIIWIFSKILKNSFILTLLIPILDLDSSISSDKGSSSLKLDNALDEQQKLFKNAHERIMKDVEV